MDNDFKSCLEIPLRRLEHPDGGDISDTKVMGFALRCLQNRTDSELQLSDMLSELDAIEGTAASPLKIKLSSMQMQNQQFSHVTHHQNGYAGSASDETVQNDILRGDTNHIQTQHNFVRAPPPFASYLHQDTSEPFLYIENNHQKPNSTQMHHQQFGPSSPQQKGYAALSKDVKAQNIILRPDMDKIPPQHNFAPLTSAHHQGSSIPFSYLKNNNQQMPSPNPSNMYSHDRSAFHCQQNWTKRKLQLNDILNQLAALQGTADSHHQVELSPTQFDHQQFSPATHQQNGYAATTSHLTTQNNILRSHANHIPTQQSFAKASPPLAPFHHQNSSMLFSHQEENPGQMQISLPNPTDSHDCMNTFNSHQQNVTEIDARANHNDSNHLQSSNYSTVPFYKMHSGSSEAINTRLSFNKYTKHSLFPTRSNGKVSCTMDKIVSHINLKHVDGLTDKKHIVRLFPGCNKTMEGQTNIELNKRSYHPYDQMYLGMSSCEEARSIKRKLICNWINPDGSSTSKPCGEEFCVMDKFVSHIRVKHVDVQDFTKYACHWQVCRQSGHIFKSKYSLVNHIRSHTGEKRLLCPFNGCGKELSKSENLKSHISTHTGEKPFKCEFKGCNWKFATSFILKKHLNVHVRGKLSNRKKK